MKRLSLLLLLSATAFLSKAQASPSPQSASSMLKQFYTAYITTVAIDDIPVMNAKIKVLTQKYCTKEFINKLPALAAHLDVDPIIKAQDSDTTILKTLNIKRNLKNLNDYTVCYAFTDIYAKPGTTTTTIHLTVINQNGIYKIDDIR